MDNKYDDYQLLDFVKEVPEWESIITNAPYNVTVKKKGSWVLFSYHQFETKWCKLTKECRGCIINLSTKQYVCRPFTKFFNVQESQAAKIDWGTARVQQKMDGSLIKIYPGRSGWWFIATNGTMDASIADLNAPEGISNFALLVWYTLGKMGYGNMEFNDFGLDQEYTHLFELCTPYNRVVVPHKEFILYYLGSVHNETGKEVFFEEITDYFPTFKTYSLFSKEDCLKAASELPFDEEGYVVCDQDNNRVKIKGGAYLVAHRLRGEGLTPKRIIDMIRIAQVDDYLSFYPEDIEVFEKYKDGLNRLYIQGRLSILAASMLNNLSRKEFAESAKKNKFPDLMFSFADGKVKYAQEYFDKMSLDKITKLVEEIVKS